MRFEDFVGLRYLMAKRDRNMLSVITLISVSGVAVGVMALIVVLSVMGGFEADFREKIIGSKSHVVVSASEGYLDDYEAIREIVRTVPNVEGVNAFVEAEVMLNSPTNLQVAILRGVDYREITTTTKLGEYMEEGRLEYLEDPDALPSITTVGSVERRGSLVLHSDTEDGGLSKEKADKLEKAGARASIAFAGNKHGEWLAKGGEIEISAIARGDAPAGNAPAVVEDLVVPELEHAPDAPDLEDAPDAPAIADEALLRLIGEDHWVDGSAPRRQPGALDEPVYDRVPNADIVVPNKRSRQMKAIPGLTADDVGVRRVGAIVLGRELKQNLTMYLGAELNVMSPSGDVGPTGGLPKSRPFKLVGSYYSGMFDFDAKMGYISLQDAQALLGIGDRVSGIDVRCTRLEDSLKVRDELRRRLADYPNVRVDDWRTLNASLFSAIMLEKVAMFVILTSIILVASFNILCLLIMMVIEKAREIAIFKAMGATDGSIVRMFVVQGGVIGGLGTVIGLILGLGLCALITSLGLKMPGDVHYITQIPVTVVPEEVVLICVASIGISLLATVLPSRMAVKLDPVEGLRCE
ncbi:MAG: ABC transporter permease [Proteobacteria bacterium]|nr:ABC transporter permease [Pseudomonadota bacterium]